MIKKESSLGARHGPTERQRIYFQAHNTLRKATNKGHSTTFDRILNSPRYGDSLTKIGWDEHIFAACDAIASEYHSYIATKWERSRSENSSKLVLNSEGANGPVDQRGDYKEEKKICDRLCSEYAATVGYVNTRIHPKDQVRQKDQTNNRKYMKMIF